MLVLVGRVSKFNYKQVVTLTFPDTYVPHDAASLSLASKNLPQLQYWLLEILLYAGIHRRSFSILDKYGKREAQVFAAGDSVTIQIAAPVLHVLENGFPIVVQFVALFSQFIPRLSRC